MRYRRLWALVLLVGIVPTAAAERWWVLLDRPPTSTLESRLETAGARVHRVSRWLNAYSVEADPLARERIAQLPFVRELRPVARYRRTVVRPELSLSAPAQETTDRLAPYRQAIQADRLQSWGLDGTGVRIGVLDSGFRLEHRALQSVQVVAAWDFVHGDAIVSDEPGQDDPLEDAHGTQVLGVLAADWDRAYRGVAPAAEYVLAKTEDVSQNGRVVEQVVEEDNWVAGLEWCAELGCEVVNSSLGYPMGYAFADLDGATAITSRAVAEAARRGVLVVVAAGNWDPQVPAESGLRGRIYPPADAPDALAVGAVSLDGRRWPQSAQGPTADGRIKPDLMAPGVGVPTLSPSNPEGFTFGSGTSLSAPLVAGVAALLRQSFPTVPMGTIGDALRRTATQSGAPNPQMGYGIAQAEAAFQWLALRYQPAHVPPEATAQPALWGDLKRQVLLQKKEKER